MYIESLFRYCIIISAFVDEYMAIEGVDSEARLLFAQRKLELLEELSESVSDIQAASLAYQTCSKQYHKKKKDKMSRYPKHSPILNIRNYVCSTSIVYLLFLVTRVATVKRKAMAVNHLYLQVAVLQQEVLAPVATETIAPVLMATALHHQLSPLLNNHMTTERILNRISLGRSINRRQILISTILGRTKITIED